MSYPLPYYIKNPTHRITIDVVGCGGTGSFLIPRLARMNFALKQLGHPGFFVNAYDFDKIEFNNVGRQNFYENDIDDYKSVNIIEKVNMAYGLDWNAFIRAHDGILQSNITIMCVDNMSFRKKVYAFKKKHSQQLLKRGVDYMRPMFILDCGNGKDFGQIILTEAFNDGLLKSLYDLYPNADKQDNFKVQRTHGCSYGEKFNEQDLFINDNISAKAADLLWDVFTLDQIDAQGVILNQFSSIPIKV